GRRAAALRQYQLCVDVLRRDLGAEPEAETAELYLSILQGHAGGSDAPAAPGSGARARRRPAPARGTDAPLVGRAAAMRELIQALDQAADGHGRVMLIAGEAGIGKTRLVAELGHAAARRGFKALIGRAYRSEQVLPFRPFIDALRTDGCLGDGALREAL